METDMMTDEQVKLSDEEDDEGLLKLDSFQNTSSYNIDMTVDMVESYYKRNKFELEPEFQRRYVWDPKRKSKFIESLILNIPVPSLLFAERLSDNKLIVIDGKQRINAILDFIAPAKDGAGFKLSGLEVLTELNGYSYKDLCEDDARVSLCASLQNYVLKASIVRHYQESLLYFIFARLNSGSVPLSSQELRYTLFPGGFAKFINETSENSQELKRLLNLRSDKSDPRMRDCELLCRYYAFKYFLDEYDSYVGKFLDLTYKKLNAEWANKKETIESDYSEFRQSISFCYDLFGPNAFKPFDPERGEYLQWNRLVYDLLAVFFSYEANRQLILEEGKEEFVSFYQTLFADPDFAYGFKPVTSDPYKTHTRFAVFEKRFGERFRH